MTEFDLTRSQWSLCDGLGAYLASRSVVHSPAILAGTPGCGKSFLARRLAAQHGARYINLAIDHLQDLVRYHSFARINPDEVYRLVVRLATAEPDAPLIVDGLEPVLVSISANSGHRPEILENLLTALKRSRGLPAPLVVVLQLSSHVPESLLRRTGWREDPQLFLLQLTQADKRVIGENLQVTPSTAESAASAVEIALARFLI